MTVIKCPAFPYCQKTFAYPGALKAHILTCVHANNRLKSKSQLSKAEARIGRSFERKLALLPKTITAVPFDDDGSSRGRSQTESTFALPLGNLLNGPHTSLPNGDGTLLGIGSGAILGEGITSSDEGVLHTSTGSDVGIVAQQTNINQGQARQVTINMRRSRMASPTMSSTDKSDENKGYVELALLRNVNKGSVVIARQSTVHNLIEPKEKGPFRRQYTSYWALEKLPQLQRVYTPKRDNVNVLLSTQLT